VTSVSLIERSECSDAPNLLVGQHRGSPLGMTTVEDLGSDEGRQGLNPRGAVDETVRRGEELYRKLGEQLPNVAVLVFDREQRVLVALGEALTSHGVLERDVEGRPLVEVMDADTYQHLKGLYEAALLGERMEVEHTSPGGRSFRVFGKPMIERDGSVWAGLALAQDITDLRAIERDLRNNSERLVELSQHDDLTKLANRLLFRDRLKHALLRARRTGTQVAVIFLDVDRFKTVNDTLGHPIGDRLLQAVAGILTSSMREVDTVARLGGDEFAVLVEELHTEDEATNALKRILTGLSGPLVLGDTELLLSVSLGVAFGPRHGTTWDALLGAADRAMYYAKADGGRQYRVYNPAMRERASERLATEAALHHAVRRNELVLHYQPAIELATGEVTGLEALVRWNHPARGLLAPGEFIPMAEEIGLAAEITEWVIHEACAQIKLWRDGGQPPLRVAINSCSRELSGGLCELVKRELSDHGLPGDALEIEITERFLGHDDDVRDAMLVELKELGVWITLDDFGTGYSSLARLRAFPVDVLKIDRMFIDELPENDAIAESVIGLARNLGLRVIAEGVENERQYAWLEQSGCNAAAGYLLCRPQPPEQLTAWLAQHHDGSPHAPWSPARSP
jgi:diguanylate cyclase (GGDEF)-like protein/PAS domain S-box-containing protein